MKGELEEGADASLKDPLLPDVAAPEEAYSECEERRLQRDAAQQALLDEHKVVPRSLVPMCVGILFIPASMVTTSYLGKIGNLSNGVINAAWAVGAVASGGFVTVTRSERAALTMGGSAIVMYMLALLGVLWRPQVVLYGVSVLVGLGNGLLWVAIGSMNTLCCIDATRGKVAGAVWAVYQLSSIAGNGLVFVFRNVSHRYLFILLAALGSLGTLSFSQTRSAPRRKDYDVITPDAGSLQPAKHSPSTRSPHGWGLTVARGALVWSCWALVALAVGVEGAFWSGEFPLLVAESNLGAVMACVGVGNMFGGFLYGKVLDKAGPGAALVLAVCCMLAALGLSCCVKYGRGPIVAGIPVLLFPSALGYGLSDSGKNCAMAYEVGRSYPHSPGAAFAALYFFQQVGLAVGMTASIFMPFHNPGGNTQLYVILGFQVVVPILYSMGRWCFLYAFRPK